MNAHELPRADRWSQTGNGWTLESRDWQIVIDKSAEIDEDDLPGEMGVRVVGAKFLTRISVEPIGAPLAAHGLVRRVARTIARGCIGAAIDLQTQEVIAKSGNVRPATPRKGEVISVLSMNWWSLDPVLQTDAAARELVKYFQAHLPEFLPERYGPHEPPPFRFDLHCPEPFYEYLKSEPFFGIWRPQGRFFDVTYPAGWGSYIGWTTHIPPIFRVPHLALTCPAGLLDQPGWETALRRCWKAVSLLVRPFYADVRILSRYPTSGRSFSYARETELHPISGWRGLPRNFGIATVIGPPYDKLLPEFLRTAEVLDGLAFQSVDSWRDGGDVTQITGSRGLSSASQATTGGSRGAGTSWTRSKHRMATRRSGLLNRCPSWFRGQRFGPSGPTWTPQAANRSPPG